MQEVAQQVEFLDRVNVRMDMPVASAAQLLTALPGAVQGDPALLLRAATDLQV